MAQPRTLYDKIWDDHLVHAEADGASLIYIDRHLVHEVTSPQAFEGLRLSGRRVRAPQKTLAVVDHNVPPPIARMASTIPKAAFRSNSSPRMPGSSASNISMSTTFAKASFM